MTESHRGREGFGNRLRALRLDAGLTGKELADRLSWAASKVSRLEHGRQTASADDVAAWVMACGAGPEIQDDLLADLRSLRAEYATWRRQFRTGFAGRQQAGIPLLAATSMVRAFETAMVPGLLQTPDYARHVFVNNAAFQGGAPDIEAALQTRMKRQEFLYEPEKRFRFVVTEAALRYLVCPPATLRAQLDRLVVLSGLDTVELAVLPFEARLPKSPGYNFWIYDDRLVLVETVTAELSLRNPEDIELYARLFELFWEVSRHGDDAIALITELVQQLRATEDPATRGKMRP
ncbi:MAG: helix-turn-helix transcriptional regulator [Actinomycetota bacterium]|nr:helix-turn-helix transcriptional regulator [Actinomycetota bacterium]